MWAKYCFAESNELTASGEGGFLGQVMASCTADGGDCTKVKIYSPQKPKFGNYNGNYFCFSVWVGKEREGGQLRQDLICANSGTV